MLIEDIIKQFLEKLYPWHFHVAGAVIILAMLAFFYFMFFGVHKFTKSISSLLEHDQRMENLWRQMDAIREENSYNKTLANFSSRIVFNIKPYMDSLNEIRLLSDPRDRVVESSYLMQRVLDGLASDIKYKSEENHRCCVWIIDNNELRPAAVSAGFPAAYKQTRALDRDRSVAGRAFRTRQTQNIDDVTRDTEWVRNPDSRSKYKSLICVPIGSVGVLTIDGIEPMSTECQSAAELFAAVIEGAINEYYMATRMLEFNQFDIEGEEDVG